MFITALPVFILNTSEDRGPAEFTLRDYIGVCVWLAGFVLETTADYQKQQWSAVRENKKFIKTGLWSVSRHPNCEAHTLPYA